MERGMGYKKPLSDFLKFMLDRVVLEIESSKPV